MQGSLGSALCCVFDQSSHVEMDPYIQSKCMTREEDTSRYIHEPRLRASMKGTVWHVSSDL